jgi:hypothetical protein
LLRELLTSLSCGDGSLAEAELLSLLSAGKQPHRIGDQVKQELGRPRQGGQRKLVGVGSECVR